MVNLEELLESEKKPYSSPVMRIKFLDWQDIVTSSDLSNKTEDPDYTQGNGNDQLDDPFGG